MESIIQVNERIRPKVGQYSVRHEPLDWIGCRERIAALFTESTPGIFFSHEPDQGNRIAKFFLKTENILDLSNKTVFQKTNYNYVLWCSPTPFWLSCGVRRSLLTILLRQGLRYNPNEDNYEEALFRQDAITKDYAKNTRNAILRFLFGFTKYNGKTSYAPGWTSLFQYATEKQVREALVCHGETEKCLVGAGKLWG